MNEETAKIIIEILLKAHQECSLCSDELIDVFSEKFPQFKDLAYKMYNEKFNFSE